MENYNCDKATEGNGKMLQEHLVGRSDLLRKRPGMVSRRPWLGGSVGLSVVPYTKRLWVQSLVRVGTGCNRWMFLSH